MARIQDNLEVDKMRLKNCLWITFLAFASVCFSAQEIFSFRSLANLKKNERNLDILADKSGRISQLIQELQGTRVNITTGNAVGVPIALEGITTDDTIVSAIVLSSGNLILASTTTGDSDARILWQSKIPGAMGSNINLVFTQKALGDPTSTQLTINTTGYEIEVKLSTGNNSANFSSATMVVNAIRSHSAANSLVRVSTVAGGGIGTVVERSKAALSPGSGIVQGFYSAPLNSLTIPENGFVSISTSGVVTSNDAILWIWNDRDGR